MRGPSHPDEALRVPGGEAADPRHRAVLAKLAEGYERATTAEGFQQYLRIVSKLWSYSPRNVALIFAQRPEATMVASYRRWQDLGRQVNKGEHGITIFVPYRRIEKQNETDADHAEATSREVVTGFGLGTVFDISQTAGEPIPQPPAPQEHFGTSDVCGLIDRKLSLWLLGQGLRLEKQPLPRSRGTYHPVHNSITIANHLPNDDGRLKTLLHEAVHFAGQHAGTAWEQRWQHELVAEGTAYATLLHFGIDVGGYSFPYLTYWGKTTGAITGALPEIAMMTRMMVGVINGEPPDGEEQWL